MFKINDKIKKVSGKALDLCFEEFGKVEKIVDYNQQKMLKAFIDHRVSESHFNISTGYGYGDSGRDTLDKIYAQVFECEDALVRHNFVSGTHALTVALFGVLRPGDTMLCVTGPPYDTLRKVIGLGQDYSSGSLKEYSIDYDQVDLQENGSLNFEEIKKKVNSELKMVYIQRSRGYTLRPSLFIDDIKKIVQIVKKISSEIVIMLDNCYGEFVEKDQPLKYGVDLMVGSLIKNPGGAIASTGGYIAGGKDLIEKCACRLTTPGTGKTIGATLGLNRELFMGTFNAPYVTGEALKTAIFSSALFELLGYEVSPRYNEPRADIVQVIKLGCPELLISFCQAIQSHSPIDSFLKLEPWDMPGYQNKIIMASGSFTLGSSIELSADAPLKEPYAVWLQGGVNFHSAKIGVMSAASKITDAY